MRKFYAKPDSVIPLGFVGEHEALTVYFDVSHMMHTGENPSFMLTVRRPKESNLYPAPITVENDVVKWVVRKIDLLTDGYGKCELIMIDGDTVSKSGVYTTQIGRSLSSDPMGCRDHHYHHSNCNDKPYYDWVEKVLRTADIIEKSRAEQFDVIGGHLLVTKVDGTVQDLGPVITQVDTGVLSVNGKSGVVVLTAEDVGAITSVNGMTGDVVLTPEDIGAVPQSEESFIKTKEIDLLFRDI